MTLEVGILQASGVPPHREQVLRSVVDGQHAPRVETT
jgi:hypothetical protein